VATAPAVFPRKSRREANREDLLLFSVIWYFSFVGTLKSCEQ
jgi:hypothetical protein